MFNGDGLYVCYVLFVVSNLVLFVNFSWVVNVVLYEWVGDLNNNNEVDVEELQEIVINFYFFNGIEGLGMIMFLVFFEGEGIFLKDSIYYIISV